VKLAKLKEVATALREGCEMMPATGRKRSEWIGRASHLCADLGLEMLAQEAREKEHPTLTPEVRALIQAAEKVKAWLISADTGAQVLKEMQGALATALAPFTESSPKPLTPEQEREMEYLESPGCCPFCNSDEISATSSHGFEGREGWQDIECESCRMEWKEVFTMTSIEMVDATPFKLSQASEG
jgi:formate dehydrogenase maturation protein FdhE